jgi:hypothetical protein
LNIGGFIISWVFLSLYVYLFIKNILMIQNFYLKLPYAIVSMYTAFVNAAGISNKFYATLPSIFAKGSMLWPSLIYMLTNKNMRKRIFKSEYLSKIDSKLTRRSTTKSTIRSTIKSMRRSNKNSKNNKNTSNKGKKMKVICTI